MKISKLCISFFFVLLGILLFFDSGFCNSYFLENIESVQKYNRAIHVMAMLVVGFGFLMVFIKKYGRSALTATYLLVSIAIPFYMLINAAGIFCGSSSEIDRLILSEFATASLLICVGAPLGRLKMSQYILLGLLFIPFYSFNEWILLDNGLGLIPYGFVDTGGSIVIHAFGAIFGFGVILTMTTKDEFNKSIDSDENSDKFSLFGSMLLWLFWPSFCGALVSPSLIPHTAINVILALSGSTISTYFMSVTIRGKISTSDIANATLAGGVAIGSTCEHSGFVSSFIIGVLAGGISTFGFGILQEKIQNLVKGIDTCGIMYLHGIPGILGGIAAIFVVNDINKTSQLIGIVITVLLASISGFIVGKIISMLGRKNKPYDDVEEFIIE